MLDAENPAFGKFALAAVGDELEELEQDARLVVAGDEGALALAAHHESLGFQFVERLADGALRHAEIGGDLELARQRRARLPFAVDDALDQEIARLAVERAESERLARGGACGFGFGPLVHAASTVARRAFRAPALR